MHNHHQNTIEYTRCYMQGREYMAHLRGRETQQSSIISVVPISNDGAREALKVEKGRESINATRERNQSNTNIYKIQSSFYSL